MDTKNDTKSIEKIIYVILGFIAISTMVNTPGIGYGYGLVYIVFLYAAYRFRPLEAATLFGVAHVIGLIVMITSKAIFLTVALASTILRPLVAGVVSWTRIRRGLGFTEVAVLVAMLDSIIALSIAILYYGDNGIHVGLTPYEVILAIYALPLIKAVEERAGSILIIVSMAAIPLYILSVYAFLSIVGVLAASLSAVLAYKSLKEGGRTVYSYLALIVILTGIILGGAPLQYNAKVMLYPFNPVSYTGHRWMQVDTDEGCPRVDNVFGEVYDPERLRIVDTCMFVEGTVVGAPKIVDDGDYVFDVRVDQGYKDTLSLGSWILRRGTIHIEVVPGDYFEVLAGLGGVCPGDRVRVTGVFVVDTDHGLWSEIHPAYRIEVLKKGSEVDWPDCIKGMNPTESD